MDRRRVLRLVGAGLVAGSAGCSSVAEVTARPPYLEDVHVQNADPVAHEFRVVVVQEGTRVHETTFELGGREQREYGGPYRPWEILACEWAGRGPFEVSCTVDGDRTETTRVDASDSEGAWSHAQVVFEVDDTGTLRGDVEEEYRPTDCDEPTPTPD